MKFLSAIARETHGGFTLVECLLASSILCLLSLALIEGIVVSRRLAREQSELLAAEAIAWDAAWMTFNGDFSNGLAGGTYTLSKESSAQPILFLRDEADTSVQILARYDTEPKLTVTVGETDEAGFSASRKNMCKITVDVAWGPAGRRRSLADYEACPCVFRSNLRRAR